jgi:hypothetical protein
LVARAIHRRPSRKLRLTFCPVFAALPLAGDVFSKAQVDVSMELKWEEVHAYQHTPHPVEFKLYDSG